MMKEFFFLFFSYGVGIDLKGLGFHMESARVSAPIFEQNLTRKNLRRPQQPFKKSTVDVGEKLVVFYTLASVQMSGDMRVKP